MGITLFGYKIYFFLSVLLSEFYLILITNALKQGVLWFGPALRLMQPHVLQLFIAKLHPAGFCFLSNSSALQVLSPPEAGSVSTTPSSFSLYARRDSTATR